MLPSEDIDDTFKIVFLGDCSVGKTSIIKRYLTGAFEDQSQKPTMLEMGSKIDCFFGKQIKLMLWDTAGSERFRSVTKSYYQDAAAAIIVYDITNPKSFASLDHWFEELLQQSSSQLDPSVVILGNKVDLREQRAVEIHTAEEYAVERDIFYVEASAKTGVGIDLLFRRLVKDILNRRMDKSKLTALTSPSHYIGSRSAVTGVSGGSEYDENRKQKRCC